MSIFWKKDNEEKKNKQDQINEVPYKNKNKSANQINLSKDDDLEIERESIRTDVLLDISTFLARRWSNIDNATVVISRGRKTTTNIEKKKIVLPELNYFYGNT